MTDPKSNHGNTKVCPACAEDVKAAANVCKHCGHVFDTAANRGAERRQLGIRMIVGLAFLVGGLVGMKQNAASGFPAGGALGLLGVGVLTLGHAFWRAHQIKDKEMGEVRRKMNERMNIAFIVLVVIFGLIAAGTWVAGKVVEPRISQAELEEQIKDEGDGIASVECSKSALDISGSEWSCTIYADRGGPPWKYPVTVNEAGDWVKGQGEAIMDEQ